MKTEVQTYTIKTKNVESSYIATWDPVTGPTALCSLERKREEHHPEREAARRSWLVKYILQDVNIAQGLSVHHDPHDSAFSEQVLSMQQQSSKEKGTFSNNNFNIKLVCFEEGLSVAVAYLLFKDKSEVTYAVSIQVPSSRIVRLRVLFPSISDRLTILFEKIDALTTRDGRLVVRHVVDDLLLICYHLDKWIDSYILNEVLCKIPLRSTAFPVFRDRSLVPQVLQALLSHHRCVLRADDKPLVELWLRTTALFLPDHKLSLSSLEVRDNIIPDLYLQGTTAHVEITPVLYQFRYPCCIVDVGALHNDRSFFSHLGPTPECTMMVFKKERLHVLATPSQTGGGEKSGGGGAAGSGDPANILLPIPIFRPSAGPAAAGSQSAGGGLGGLTAAEIASGALTDGIGTAAYETRRKVPLGSGQDKDIVSGLVEDVCDRIYRMMDTHNASRSAGNVAQTPLLPPGTPALSSSTSGMDAIQQNFMLTVLSWKRDIFFRGLKYGVKEVVTTKPISVGPKPDRSIYISFFEPIAQVEGLRESREGQKILNDFNAF